MIELADAAALRSLERNKSICGKSRLLDLAFPSCDYINSLLCLPAPLLFVIGRNYAPLGVLKDQRPASAGI
jgi:hypothetical protein